MHLTAHSTCQGNLAFPKKAATGVALSEEATQLLGKGTDGQLTPETGFEKQRGVSRIETRTGFAQVHVSRLEQPIMAERIRVLEAVAAVGVSIDFLKLTPSGLSFIVPEDRYEVVDEALHLTGVEFSNQKGRSIVLVHAVNMRDEEGLIALAVQAAIRSGAKVDHVGDMHDRMLMVVSAEDAELLEKQFAQNLMEAGHAH